MPYLTSEQQERIILESLIVRVSDMNQMLLKEYEDRERWTKEKNSFQKQLDFIKDELDLHISSLRVIVTIIRDKANDANSDIRVSVLTCWANEIENHASCLGKAMTALYQRGEQERDQD